ncbi:hypothetical protein C8P68_10284 [Mucilaginibacter yixingensis]|uniref:Uncharacterized protein n=1 Tax=Mucilaginibacter yixingensis TaxID=1295612 RepID=A0A2T5JBZ3_9SPHI|nr:hypothetical protein [Mucilaginibacter yixingensis]PTQ99268.1 hypothetical protein C8P68_10284 [Mucilaginibacter yixingensis]
METFFRCVIIAIVPVIQLMMVIWRVQFKIDVSIGRTALICFFLSICTAVWAASISGGDEMNCLHCGQSRVIESIAVFCFALIINLLFSAIVSLIALAEYKVALKNRGLA